MFAATASDLPPIPGGHDALDATLAFRQWDPRLKAFWRQRMGPKIARELRFLHGTGLALCVACLVLDAQAGVLELGLVLRLGLVAPLYLAAIIVLRKARGVVCTAAAIAPIAAFAASATCIGLAAGSAFADRYALAASMLTTACIVLFPLRASGAALLGAAGFLAISIPLLVSSWPKLEFLDLVSFAFLCSTIPVLIKLRSDRLRDENFVLALKARVTQDELLESNRRLEDLSSLDPLTGLLNRRGFQKRFEAAFQPAQLSAEPLALLLIDLDHFKAFNDTYGHQLGDQCLAAVGEVLQSEVGRHHGIAGRFGGEEFIAVLIGAASANCVSIAQRMGKVIRDLALTDKHNAPVSITASIGVRISRSRTAVPHELIEEADRALYAAKNAGRDCVVLFTDDMETAGPAEPLTAARPRVDSHRPVQSRTLLSSERSAARS